MWKSRLVAKERKISNFCRVGVEEKGVMNTITHFCLPRFPSPFCVVFPWWSNVWEGGHRRKKWNGREPFVPWDPPADLLPAQATRGGYDWHLIGLMDSQRRLYSEGVEAWRNSEQRPLLILSFDWLHGWYNLDPLCGCTGLFLHATISSTRNFFFLLLWDPVIVEK